MNSIEELVEKISEAKKLAGSIEEIEAFRSNPSVYRVKKGKIERAKKDLEQLFYDYRKEVQDRAVFILITGSLSSEVAKIAEDKFECFSLSADSFYETLLSEVPDTLYKDKVASRALFEHVSTQFEGRALSIGIHGYSPFYFDQKHKKHLNNKSDAVDLIKLAFNEKIGSEVVGLDAIDLVAEKAVNQSYTGSVAPIVLHSKDEVLIEDLALSLKNIGKRGHVVLTGAGKSKLKDIAISRIKSAKAEEVKKTLLKIKEVI